MPLDYSKWDALELSDDSDIEVHPNVDKRSFIRAKQNQIHQERAQRKHEIETLKYERIVNDGLLTRIDALIGALNKHADEVVKRGSDESGPTADELVFQSLLESAGPSSSDKPPTPPAGVHSKTEEQPTYSKMMAALVDQVKKTVDEEKPLPEKRLQSFAKEVGSHKTQVLNLQQKLLERLAELQKLEGSKITSESIHDGFSSSSVAKATAGKAASVELLNPGGSAGAATASKTESTEGTPNTALDSGSEADTEGGPDPSLPSPINDRSIHPTKMGLAFANLPRDDYNSYLRFIAQNPEVLRERETDGLLMRAFDLQYAGKELDSRQAVHQALLLQYCRQLGRDGVQLFFKRVTTKDHQARKMFLDDVKQTYGRLRTRAAEMLKEGTINDGPGGEEGGDIEQIQLHAVNPGEKIQISVPPSQENCKGDEEKAARAIFETFPPNLKKALETGELDEVNKVLGRMPVSEAEEVVEKLGEGGMLSLEQGVVDATTDEGKEFMKNLEGERVEDVTGEPGDAEEGGKAVDMVD